MEALQPQPYEVGRTRKVRMKKLSIEIARIGKSKENKNKYRPARKGLLSQRTEAPKPEEEDMDSNYAVDDFID